MSDRLTQLTTDRDAKMARLGELLPTAQDGSLAPAGDSPTWTDETQAEYDRLIHEVQAIDQEVSRFNAYNELNKPDPTITEAAEAAAKAAALANAGASGRSVDEDTAIQIQARKDFATWLNPKAGEGVLAADAMMTNPLTDIQAVGQSVGTDSEGGHLVPEIVRATIIETLKAFGGMRSVATVETVATGRKVNIPGSDGTSEMAVILNENDQATNLDSTFTSVSVEFDRWNSRILRLSLNLIQDAEVDVMSWASRRLGERMARAQNNAFTLGSTISGSHVRGIVEDLTRGHQETGTTNRTNFTFEGLLGVIHSVDAAYRSRGARFMLSDKALQALRSLKDTQGRPLWLPSISETDTGRLLGYPYTVNNDVAEPAAGAKAIYFGDLSAYHIFDARAFRILRLDDSPYSTRNQVGIFAEMRSAGRLIDTNTAKTLDNAA